jgi:hypothetical protein
MAFISNKQPRTTRTLCNKYIKNQIPLVAIF